MHQLKQAIKRLVPIRRAMLISWFLGSRTELRWLRRRPGRPHSLPGELILSLTSYSARFTRLPLTLKCLLTQSVSPDRTILWIAEADRGHLPPGVLALQRHGLEIRFCDDLRSYKKIIPALEAFPAAFIVTADDDIYYPRTWLEDLLNAREGDNTKTVICHRAHRIVLGANGSPLPYDAWQQKTRDRGPSPLVFPTGSGGVL